METTCPGCCGSTAVPRPWEVWDWPAHSHDSLCSVSLIYSFPVDGSIDDDGKTTRRELSACRQQEKCQDTYRATPRIPHPGDNHNSRNTPKLYFAAIVWKKSSHTPN